MKYKRIILLGFRCTGKTYGGKLLSEKMGWKFIDIDSEIEKAERKTIAEISENGKNWKKFRSAEFKMLKKLLKKNNVIISAGGGVGVNDIPLDDKRTFGEVEAEILKKDANTLKVLFTAGEEIIKARLMKSEKEKRGNRPVLNSKMAESSKEKSLEEIVEHNLEIFRNRKSGYENLADVVIENKNDLTANKILGVINGRNN